MAYDLHIQCLMSGEVLALVLGISVCSLTNALDQILSTVVVVLPK